MSQNRKAAEEIVNAILCLQIDLKEFRKTLCGAQIAMKNARYREIHITRLQRLIDEVDRNIAIIDKKKKQKVNPENESR